MSWGRPGSLAKIDVVIDGYHLFVTQIRVSAPTTSAERPSCTHRP